MIFFVTQYYIKVFKPWWNGIISKFLYKGSRVKIGKNFRSGSIPRIIVDKGCILKIGDNVEFQRNVEIRCHGNSEVIINNNIKIDRGVRILSANKAKVIIDEGTKIGLYSVLNGGDCITIGKKVLISGFVYLQTSMHEYQKKGDFIQDQGYLHSPLKLEDDTWLGTHVVIMPGVTLGRGTVVGSNAVVTKSSGNYQVLAGIPAVPIKKRL